MSVKSTHEFSVPSAPHLISGGSRLEHAQVAIGKLIPKFWKVYGAHVAG